MGNALVLQSGGVTAVINASLIGIVESAKASGPFAKIYGAKYGILGLINSDLIDLTHLSEEQMNLIKKSPSAFLGSSRIKLNKETVEQALKKTIIPYDIDTIFMIGGNDTAHNADYLYKCAKELNYQLKVIGVPKTIDNDLPYMYYCPGYGSVARFIAITTQEVGLDSLAMRYSDPIKIIEVMGRNAGWIVGASAVLKKKPAQPPHLLCFPEVLLDIDVFVEKVKKIYRQYGFVIVVVSETIRDLTGRPIGEKKEGVTADGFGHQYVESPAQRLCSILEDKLSLRARYDKPGTIQRMSVEYVSVRDREDAYRCGCYAVELAKKGLSGVEVVLGDNSFSYVPIEDIANKERKLPENFINETKDFITEDFRKYCLDLLGDNLPDYSCFY